MPNATPISERIARIAAKVQARGLRLGDCLGEDRIVAFEKQHGILLPEGYRAFILTVGNGGAGPPEYGCAALGETADDMSEDGSRAWTELHRVKESFPFTEAWVWEDGDPSSEGSHEQVQDGSIYLGNDGCGQYWFLVVNGPERGNVWMLADVGVTPTSPKRDFLQWYEDWLDGATEWWA